MVDPLTVALGLGAGYLLTRTRRAPDASADTSATSAGSLAPPSSSTRADRAGSASGGVLRLGALGQPTTTATVFGADGGSRGYRPAESIAGKPTVVQAVRPPKLAIVQPPHAARSEYTARSIISGIGGSMADLTRYGIPTTWVDVDGDGRGFAGSAHRGVIGSDKNDGYLMPPSTYRRYYGETAPSGTPTLRPAPAQGITGRLDEQPDSEYLPSQRDSVPLSHWSDTTVTVDGFVADGVLWTRSTSSQNWKHIADADRSLAYFVSSKGLVVLHIPTMRNAAAVVGSGNLLGRTLRPLWKGREVARAADPWTVAPFADLPEPTAGQAMAIGQAGIITDSLASAGRRGWHRGQMSVGAGAIVGYRQLLQDDRHTDLMAPAMLQAFWERKAQRINTEIRFSGDF